MEEWKPDTALAEKALGYVFGDKSLLEAALTHQSYANGRPAVSDNQRLEFLGDAVIGLLAAEHLYAAAPDRDEGFLTVERSRAVSGKSLAEIVRGLGLDAAMRFGKGVTDGNERSGDKTMAALCEAIFGAAWLDAGSDAARTLFARLIAPKIDASLDEGIVHGDPRGELQALAHRLGFGEPRYEIVASNGDGKNFDYEVAATVRDVRAVGHGSSKKAAAAAAAAVLLEKFASAPGEQQAPCD